jgi:signal transduction histidine kinase
MSSILCSGQLVSRGILLLTVLSMSLIALPSGYGQLSTFQDSPVMEIPQSSWYYRWGDSPVDDQGMPRWIYKDTSSSEWQAISDVSYPLSRPQGGRFLWLMLQVPGGQWKNPALLLPPVSQSLEVYQNHQLIYRSGKFKPSYSNRYWFIRLHLVPLESIEAEPGGNTLFLRIYSDSRYIGIEGQGVMGSSRVLLGSIASLIKTAVRLDIGSFIIGPLLSSVGLFSVFVYFRRRRQKLHTVLSFGAFAICIGIGHLSGNLIFQLSARAVGLRYYLATVSFVLWPIALYIFAEQILGRGYRSLIRRIWQVHILFAAVAILLDVVGVLPLPHLIPSFFVLLMIGIFIGLPIAIKAALKGNFEARILGAGMGIMMLSGMYDMLAEFGVFPRRLSLFSWSTLVFTILLAYILEHRFAEARRELEGYSLTLEQKVEERTQELREAQSQIVMQEKMASLGDLVAGVAHEINNPVGIIVSAADIARRGIHRIENLLQDKSDLDEEQLRQSLELVETNHKVIATAGGRVANIVQSLRSFARLDEALFQQVDLHKNIDITLTLIQHELRDKATVIKEYGHVPRIQCYPNELNQAFMNLLRNAAQAIEEQGTITITTYADKARVYVRISDTGKGIPLEDLPRIYDPGFTTQSGGVGKGLGLSIVYNIIQKHHGNIQVNSDVGKGTEVIIALPIDQTRV